MNPLRKFVQHNQNWFSGNQHETTQSLKTAEHQLKMTIPADIKWLLTTFGYGKATGIESMDESLKNTRLARETLGLPNQYLVLYDHGDGGVILLDTSEKQPFDQHRVLDAAWDSIPDELEQEIIYPSYQAYTESIIRSEMIGHMNNND